MVMNTTKAMKGFNAASADWAQMPLVLTVKEMALVLGIGKRKAYELMDVPGFPTVRIGGSYRVNTEGLRRYLEAPVDTRQESKKG